MRRRRFLDTVRAKLRGVGPDLKHILNVARKHTRDIGATSIFWSRARARWPIRLSTSHRRRLSIILSSAKLGSGGSRPCCWAACRKGSSVLHSSRRRLYLEAARLRRFGPRRVFRDLRGDFLLAELPLSVRQGGKLVLDIVSPHQHGDHARFVLGGIGMQVPFAELHIDILGHIAGRRRPFVAGRSPAVSSPAACGARNAARTGANGSA